MNTSTTPRLGPGYRLLGALLVSVIVVAFAFYLRELGRLYTFSYGVSFAMLSTAGWQIRRMMQRRRAAGRTFTYGVLAPVAVPIRDVVRNVRAAVRAHTERKPRMRRALTQAQTVAVFLGFLVWSLLVVQGLQMLLVRIFSSLVNPWLAVCLVGGLAVVVLLWDLLIAMVSNLNATDTEGAPEPVDASSEAS